jgi:pilus assembly protein Flp/PilA
MLLRTFIWAQVGYTEFRGALRTRLVDMAGSERGGVAAEYALLIALIAVVIVIGAAALGVAINDRLQTTADCVGSAPSC